MVVCNLATAADAEPIKALMDAPTPLDRHLG
jgi:hypothetical protein